MIEQRLTRPHVTGWQRQLEVVTVKRGIHAPRAIKSSMKKLTVQEYSARLYFNVNDFYKTVLSLVKIIILQ